MINNQFFQRFKPGITKRYLLLIAAFVWTFAGGMLLFKGINFFFEDKIHLYIRVAFSILGGIAFYLLLFNKISRKHTLRIVNLKTEKPCAFSFFNLKSYVMMSVMISMGIVLRKTGILSIHYLSELYVTMGIPLFLSAIRFYYSSIRYNHLTNNA